eukprot:TRINITY_DN6200_c0_g1_i3.p1 TRINITY_DN6200_c0_g1~~TRINITY_DN6200_c0_g1_i3.p1  ORF type:complete len:632 (-),score=89.95 TRINITY_DN6200_c0_g1_i3:145-1827(-)
MGCYLDKIAPRDRALPYVQYIDISLTVDKCVSFCAQRGFPYSGVQYGRECYCGRSLPPHGQLPESNCKMACAGDSKQICGGSLALNVYHQPDAKAPESPRPLVCLVMILKNEAHTIETTLTSVRDHVDCWYILDTGSTDGTQDKIRALMKGKPGKLHEEPFVDYGFTRNRVLNIANETNPNDRPIFTLMLSADETLMNPAHMRTFLQDMRYAYGPQHGAYPVVMNAGLDFDSVRIARADDSWRYVGRVHEYLAAPDQGWHDLYRPSPDVRVNFRATDTDRRFKSQYFIISILEDELRKNPKDTRSLFYVARTYSTVGNHTAALDAYRRLSEASSWDEEIYEGKFASAEEMKFLDRPWAEIQQALLDLHNWKPSKADALYFIGDYYFNAGKFQLAYLFAQRVVQIPQPADIWTSENVLLRESKSLYSWKGQRLLGFAANRIGEWQVCMDAIDKVVKLRPDDTIAISWRAECAAKFGTIINAVPPTLAVTPVASPITDQKRAGAASVNLANQSSSYGLPNQTFLYVFYLISFFFLCAILIFFYRVCPASRFLRKYRPYGHEV